MEDSDGVLRYWQLHAVNKRNPALDCYIDAMRDCNALRQFRPMHSLSMRHWNILVSRDVQARLLAQNHVKIAQDTIYLTVDGRELLDSKEDER